MPEKSGAAEKILASTKGLREHLQPEEKPLLAVPAIWDGGQSKTSTACDVIITNQRVIAYFMRSFPKTFTFIDTLNLADLTAITFRQKSYEPVFRELQISNDQRKVFIRAPRQKLDALYTMLQFVTGRDAAPETTPTPPSEIDTEQPKTEKASPIYGRQDIQRSFDYSPMAALLLFLGGIIFEVIAFLLWSSMHSLQISLPLFAAGLIAVIASIRIRRQQNTQ
ncbi:MAG TPA: hypothetical protein VL461_02505 [Dictyobacter sp.]|jgi:hypothetical protein|nr:hypothetical protein [Dictyobacter sp.]